LEEILHEVNLDSKLTCEVEDWNCAIPFKMSDVKACVNGNSLLGIARALSDKLSDTPSVVSNLHFAEHTAKNCVIHWGTLPEIASQGLQAEVVSKGVITKQFNNSTISSINKELFKNYYRYLAKSGIKKLIIFVTNGSGGSPCSRAGGETVSQSNFSEFLSECKFAMSMIIYETSDEMISYRNTSEKIAELPSVGKSNVWDFVGNLWVLGYSDRESHFINLFVNMFLNNNDWSSISERIYRVINQNFHDETAKRFFCGLPKPPFEEEFELGPDPNFNILKSKNQPKHFAKLPQWLLAQKVPEKFVDRFWVYQVNDDDDEPYYVLLLQKNSVDSPYRLYFLYLKPTNQAFEHKFLGLVKEALLTAIYKSEITFGANLYFYTHVSDAALIRIVEENFKFHYQVSKLHRISRIMVD
jgi:hypothetical protein